eukprot:TRINITY_DN25206_c0_g1_i2.p1 TRINITY_DN25206_c0_g1~~TRINITY_DN25206_c0_g1_i2.p1  ORF type:complete len:560 (+),score=98.51 TRINITY_DN25206_c0_g1_i2:81-1760(+)
MCSFMVASFLLHANLYNLTWVNALSRRRGPDGTRLQAVRGWSFLHNLLHMTGERTFQPFVSAGGDVVAVFNGEIYNWRELAAAAGAEGQWRSDGHALLPLYLRHGPDFWRLVHGEYAAVVADFRKGLLLVCTDAFMTKPVFLAVWNATPGVPPRLGVSSYASPLERLGAPPGAVRMAEPNSVAAYALAAPFRKRWQRPVVRWDLRQHKNSTADWVTAFEAAVRRRSTGLLHGVFVGLSSGYDSGAIMLALHRQGVPFFAYSVRGKENASVVMRRARYCTRATAVRLGSGAFVREREWLAAHCEPYRYQTATVWGQPRTGPLLWEDPAAQGLSGIARRVRRHGGLIYLSGSGADEIISDYALAPGGPCAGTCTFRGGWPRDLVQIFPWGNFYQGTQRDYIMKEELVGGAHGIETRYPFLDPTVVQEYLWLTHTAKRSAYKRPVRDYLRAAAFPFNEGEKKGFGVHDTPCQLQVPRRRRGRGRRRPCTPQHPDEERLSDPTRPGGDELRRPPAAGALRPTRDAGRGAREPPDPGWALPGKVAFCLACAAGWHLCRRRSQAT